MESRVQTHRFRHHTGYKIATYFDVESGAEFLGPREFLEYLSESEGSGQATLNAVINDLQLFLRYLCACSDLQVQSGLKLNGSGLFLNRVLFMYPSFLAEGHRSPSPFVSAVAHHLGFEGLARSSTGRYLSTVNRFLKFNDKEWISQQAVNERLEVDTFVSEEQLIEQLGKMRSLKKSEKAALLRKSMLAGCISGGPKQITRPHLSMPRRFGRPQDPDYRFYEKCFPIDKILDLIKNASSYRDICLFSLMAGTGIRTSEALQLRFEDLLIEEELVQILPYADRIQVYDDLTDCQITELAFKGRTTKDVLFLSPFKEIFFEYLLNYISEERDRFNPSHDFVFVTMANNAQGKTWFDKDSTSHNRTFKEAQRRIGIEAKELYSLHSLRHFYGTWLRNYQPNGEGGFGFPLSVVKKHMGHKFESTTEGYSLPDTRVTMSKIQRAQALIKKKGWDLTRIKKIADQ